MTTLYMIAGLPGSGKSTLSGLLAYKLQDTNVKVLSSDDLRREYGADPTNFQTSKHIFGVMDSITGLCLHLEQSVILDATFLTYSGRSGFYDRAIENDAKTCVLYVDTPINECVDRQRLRGPEERVPAEQIEQMAESFDPIHFDGLKIGEYNNVLAETVVKCFYVRTHYATDKADTTRELTDHLDFLFKST